MKARRAHGLIDLAVVLRADLADSRRSWMAGVLILLYLLGSVASSALFVYLLHQIETQIAASLEVASANSTGAMTARLWELEPFRHIIREIVGDEALAERLLRLPPLALFYGWVAITFAPILVVLTAAGSVASEIGSGSARYALVRTSRWRWCLGKLLGQASLALIGILLGGAGVWLIGQIFLTGFEPWASAVGILGFSLRGWIYSLAFLGLAVGVSQLARSQYRAWGMVLLAIIALWLLGYGADRLLGAGWERLGETLRLLTPQHHRLGLWYQDTAHLVPAVVYLATLGGLYFVLGHLLFVRRDA